MTVGGKPPAEAIAALGRRLEAIANALEGKLTDARTDFAARLTNVKGELRQEVADRLSNGFAEFRSAVEKQLSEGRTEQATTLKLEIAALTSQTSTSLDGIRSVVDSKLGVIGEQVQQKLDQNIKEGFAQFEKVQQHLAEAEKQLRNVGEIGASINDLNNLLKLPHLRGRFGEESLERLLADFLPAQMYELQAAPATGVAGRADAVIKFPDRKLPIDAKCPREQVQALFEGSDPVALEAARIDFVRV
ncbi:MAG TPA: DNA recombination protein RmuC, partial [Candidatus Binataceae bacterium]|nr:DNA recombination protein RmuC [Candidatus Binataceae bacterium]